MAVPGVRGHIPSQEKLEVRCPSSVQMPQSLVGRRSRRGGSEDSVPKEFAEVHLVGAGGVLARESGLCVGLSVNREERTRCLRDPGWAGPWGKQVGACGWGRRGWGALRVSAEDSGGP